VIGTPDDAIAQIRRLEEESGGFGTFLHMAHNWADWAETKRSYELFARYVAPEFQNRNDNRRESYEWAARNHEHYMPKVEQAIGNEIAKDEAEKAAKQ
jgi:limonene 1,2-monooxygenase